MNLRWGDDSTRSVNQSAILMCLMCRRCRRPCRRRLHLDIDVVMLHLGADVTSEIWCAVAVVNVCILRSDVASWRWCRILRSVTWTRSMCSGIGIDLAYAFDMNMARSSVFGMNMDSTYAFRYRHWFDLCVRYEHRFDMKCVHQLGCASTLIICIIRSIVWTRSIRTKWSE